MSKYICKCGRVVAKSTNADNTGNRDTAGCNGCPYLLPWGPMVWDDQQKGCTQDVKGYECRMSPTLEYASTYHGRADDKCSLHIVSLDLDFLDEVQAWIYDNAANTLSAGFSRGSMRGTDFCNRGRYSLSVTCAQNKAGMAAKAALLARFFGPDKSRRGMTPQQEKAHILAAIEAGKARAQKKEDKALTYKDPITGWLYRVSPKPDEKSCFFIEYLDPNSSVVWKRDHKAAQGHPRIDSVRRRLAYLANEKRWEPVENVPSENPTDAAEDAQPCAPTASDVPPSQFQSVDADAQKGGGDDLANPTDAAPAFPADAGAATQSLSAADPASLAAESAQPAFDYSGLSGHTMAVLQLAESEIREARQTYICRVSAAVAAAHKELVDVENCKGQDNGVVANCDNSKHGNRGEHAFINWCASVGFKKDAAYRLLQVNALLSGATPEEQATLEAASPSLLYAAAKPSAPAELVQAVKDGDITTHKQYQEAMAQLKAEREAREKAESDLAAVKHEADLDRKERDDANAAAMHYKAECDRRAAEQQRVEGLLATRENQLRASQAEVARQKRIGMEMQEEVESRDERIRELQKSQTVVAGTADPEEIERRAQEIAKAQIAENDAKWSEIAENQGRQLAELRARSSGAVAVKSAHASIEAILNQLFHELHRDYDDACLAAMEDMNDYLFATWQDIHDLLHPEDVEDVPDFDDDDEEEGYDDET